MHSDRTVLRALAEVLTGDALGIAVSRILRVPEAWAALHQPAFLTEVLAAAPGSSLSASQLGSLAIGGNLNDPIALSLLDPHRERAEGLWQATERGAAIGPDLFEVTLLGLEFVRRASGPVGPVSLAERVVGGFDGWASPLAVAWPALSEPGALLRQLIAAGQTNAALRLVLSNLPAREAAGALARASTNPVALAQAIRASGEAELAREFAAVGLGPLADRFFEPAFSAISETQVSDERNGLPALGRAWEDSTAASALIADLTADRARLEGDPVTEFEAARRSLELRATPARRAVAALALTRIGRQAEAAGMLAGQHGSIEEAIARGLVMVDSRDGAAAELRTALAEVLAGKPIEHGWMEKLAKGLWNSGDRPSALRAASKWVERFPTSCAAREEYARFLREAGDSEASSDQAALALALRPEQESARRELATSLEEAGEFVEALPHRKALAGRSEADQLALATCALRAGETALAREAMTSSVGPDSLAAGDPVLEARTLASEGSGVLARETLEHSIQSGNHQPDQFLALALIQNDQGDAAQAGETLARGVQANPASAELRIALARWLAEQGRLSEGLQAAAAAAGMEGAGVEAQLTHADLLRRLGHLDEAIGRLREAARLQPLSWRVGLALAETLADRGDLLEAGRLAAVVPTTAPADSLFRAGRVCVLAGDRIEVALRSLQTAEAKGAAGPELDYWLGRGYEAAGVHGQAIERFERSLARLPEEQAEFREGAALGIARNAFAAGQTSVALTTLERALEWFRDSAEILALMSEIYLASGLVGKAVELARQSVQADPSRASAWRALGRAFATTGAFDSAVEALEQLSSHQPANTAGWLELAELALEHSNEPVARRAAAEAAWRGRHRPELLGKLAEVLTEQGWVRTSLRFLRAGLRAAPDDFRLRARLATVTEAAGDQAGALQAWLNAAEVQPEEPAPLVHGAHAATQLGKLGLSIELLERAARLAPRDASTQIALAQGYFRVGRIDDGLAAFEAAGQAPADDDLPLEVVETCLLAGALDRVGPWIERARQIAGQPDRLQLAVAEINAAQGNWPQAVQAIEEALAAGGGGARLLSLHAIALSTTDASLAFETLQAATEAGCHSAHEAIWLSRAQFRLLKWSEAAATLEPWSSEPHVARERALTLLRLASAGWAFRAAQADAHAPSAAPADLAAAAKSVIDELTGQGLGEAAMGPIQEALAATQQALEDGRPIVAVLPEVCQEQWMSVIGGLSQEAAGDPAAARAAYRRASEDPVLAPMGDFLLGRSYSRAKRTELATSHLNAAVTAWPMEPAWHHELGSHYAQTGEFDAAVVHIQQAVELDPSKPTYQLELARVLRRSGQLSMAEGAYQKVLRALPDSTDALREAAETALELGKTGQAADWFDHALSIDPENQLALLGSARVASQRGQSKRANELLARASELGGDTPELLLTQGHIHADRGEIEPAIKAFEQAMHSGADPTSILRLQSDVLLKNGQAARATAALEQALQSAPEDHGLWHQLALAREAAADWEAAGQAVQEAVRSSPMQAEYRITAGRIARRGGQLDRAIEELLQAGSIDPSNPAVSIELGKVYESRRDLSRALATYQKAISLDPNSLEAHYRAGVILRTLKAYKDAGEHLKRAAELAPVNQDVLHQLAAVRALELVHG